MDTDHYETLWPVEVHESTPRMYVVELNYYHIAAFISAAKAALAVPGISNAESDLLGEAVDSLNRQVHP